VAAAGSDESDIQESSLVHRCVSRRDDDRGSARFWLGLFLITTLTLIDWTGTTRADIEYDPERSFLDAATHARVTSVMAHYYNFEFDAAVEEAIAIRDSEPDNPLGHFLVAECYWWQIINNADDPVLIEEFEIASNEAIRLSERRLDRDDREAMALFFLAGAYGRQAILAGLTSEHLEAVQSSLTGRKYVKRLAKYHPEVDDAYFGIGLYDYYAADLPWFARLIGKLFLGLGGDRERGLRELERAAEHGLFTRIEARIFLAIIYLDAEERYEDAMQILQELHATYPDNLDYYGMLAFAYRTHHEYVDAIRMLRQLNAKAVDSPAFGHRSHGMTRYFLGSTYKVAGMFEPGVEELSTAIAHAEAGQLSWLQAIGYLERGRCHDVLGRRDEALADYERVLEVKDFRDSHDKARDYIESPHVVPDEEMQHHLTAEERQQLDGVVSAGKDSPGQGADSVSTQMRNAPRSP
jgi:tetratricopeptide (TPR) repeat protein